MIKLIRKDLIQLDFSVFHLFLISSEHKSDVLDAMIY